MRLLDRYLLREFLIPFGYCLVGFFIFWITFDLFSNLSEFQGRNLHAVDVVQYYVYRSPEVLSLTLPITLLLALLYALSNHTRHQELTAIRAAGVSLARLSISYFGVAFLLSVLILLLDEWCTPQSVERANQILNQYVEAQARTAGWEWEKDVTFSNTRDNRKWYIQRFHRKSGGIFRPHLDWILPDGNRREVFAEGGSWQEGQWVFTNVQERTWPAVRGAIPIQSNFPSRVMTELSETPEEIRIQIKLGKIQSVREANNARLSIREILLYQKLHPEDIKKNTMLHGRLAAPWTCLVVVLIALPFGALQGRRNVFVGVASSIVICFSYFIFQQLCLVLGFGGYIPGWVAGWMPNGLFGAGGLYMTFRIR